jgi:hypothetical protein
MTSEELLDFLYEWIYQILVIECGDNIPIIESNLNVSPPNAEDPYITIEFSGSKNKIGSASKMEPDKITGISKVINDYGELIELREVNGNGDRLRTIIDSTDRREINDLFRTNQVAYLGEEGNITPVPRLNGKDWVREALVEIRIGVATGTTEQSGVIETVEYSGTISGTQEGETEI